MSELKLKFTKDEIDKMPEIVRENAQEKDGVFVYEGDADGVVEDVHGLKSALGKERESVKELKHQFGSIREKLGLDEEADPVAAIDALAARGSQASQAAIAHAKARIISDIAAVGGNAHILADKMFNEVSIDEQTGKVSVVRDGVVQLRDDGDPMDHRDVLAQWKNDPLFAGNFIGTKQSGGGSQPSGDGTRNPIAEKVLDVQRDTNGAPPKDKPVSEMTARERMLAATVGGGLGNYPQ